MAYRRPWDAPIVHPELPADLEEFIVRAKNIAESLPNPMGEVCKVGVLVEGCPSASDVDKALRLIAEMGRWTPQNGAGDLGSEDGKPTNA